MYPRRPPAARSADSEQNAERGPGDATRRVVGLSRTAPAGKGPLLPARSRTPSALGPGTLAAAIPGPRLPSPPPAPRGAAVLASGAPFHRNGQPGACCIRRQRQPASRCPLGGHAGDQTVISPGGAHRQASPRRARPHWSWVNAGLPRNPAEPSCCNFRPASPKEGRGTRDERGLWRQSTPPQPVAGQPAVSDTAQRGRSP